MLLVTNCTSVSSSSPGSFVAGAVPGTVSAVRDIGWPAASVLMRGLGGSEPSSEAESSCLCLKA